MKVYKSIPSQVKPPPGVSQLHYVGAFESEFSMLLRDISSPYLTDMINNEIEVELNLPSSRKIKLQIEVDRKKAKEETLPSTSQGLDEKFDLMVKTMEKLVEKLSLGDRPHELQAINQNFRRPPVPQIRQREQRIPADQRVRHPFQNNYVAYLF
jgi:hypothetical protein